MLRKQNLQKWSISRLISTRCKMLTEKWMQSTEPRDAPRWANGTELIKKLCSRIRTKNWRPWQPELLQAKVQCSALGTPSQTISDSRWQEDLINRPLDGDRWESNSRMACHHHVKCHCDHVFVPGNSRILAYPLP